jgi:hypothetical protein
MGGEPDYYHFIIVTKRSGNGSHDLCQTNQAIPNNTISISIAEIMRRRVLVGWAAVTNSISLIAILLFAIIFFWTPPHFWALSILIQKDYAKANIPMMLW